MTSKLCWAPETFGLAERIDNSVSVNVASVNRESGMRIAEVELHLFGTTLETLRERVSYRRTLERVWDLVEESYRNPDLSLAMVARHGGISQNHLNVLMNRETGFSFHEILSRYRLFQACRMMMSKDYTFLEIALETGFGNVSSLERQAKKILSTSPKQLRNVLCNNGRPPWPLSTARRNDKTIHR